ncbi:hypothetical protein [Halobacillus massiliensis]|nr:hypothetical protein [Halobacillus massiliensis]
MIENATLLMDTVLAVWELCNGTLDAVAMPVVYLMAIKKADKK